MMMNKVILCLCIVASFIAFGRPKMSRSFDLLGSNIEWMTTTNELGQITKIMKSGTNTIVFIYNDIKVPLKYRIKWLNMSEDEKSFALSAEAFKLNKFNNPSVRAIPVNKNAPDASTDSKVTTEVQVLKLRPLSE